jgi:FkbM family methyltransferase
MRILIDCGANTGDSLPALHRVFGPFDKVFAFEPNAQCVNTFDKGDAAPVELMQAAVWVREGTIKLYLGAHPSESSLLLEKKTGNLDPGNFIDVPAVDFSRWLQAHVVPADYVVVKMDIEGAEFPVLEKMLAEDSIKLVDLLLPEWHADRLAVRNIRLRRKWIELRLRWKGVKVLRWSKKKLRKKGYDI